MHDPRPKTVFEAILEYGHDEDFVPAAGAEFVATGAAIGSQAKVEVLRRRVAQGQPLWHPADGDQADQSTPRRNRGPRDRLPRSDFEG